ncbi:hypothetical protein AMELA_G00273560 [Ameiurus melas]|uniref:Uncharacterized protein n=1 Tax=Ameiurus melas TaxID=219545 RepID=A0A7J5ZLE9_AMEME|nr:hypothetical protein AMELA_G00273560 [Ameiurus melas]
MSFCDAEEMEEVHKLVQKDKFMFQESPVKCAKYLEEKVYRCSKCNADEFIFGPKVATGDDDQHLWEIYETIPSNEIFLSQARIEHAPFPN